MTVWDDIASHLKGSVSGPSTRHRGVALLRFSVTRVRPLTLDQIDGDEALEEGDDDFTIGDSVRAYREERGLSVGDVIRVADDGDEFLAIEVISDRSFG